MMSISSPKFIRHKDLLTLFFLLLAGVFLLWKCQYGIANIDESFYLTIPLRLCSGDALFVSEWNLSQMSAILTTPIIWLYVAITKSLDGIVLFMRYFYVIVHCAIAIIFYFRFQKLSWLGATCASLSFLLYVPYGIMALSYNSMAIMGLVLCITLLGPNESFRRVDFVLAGISFSAAVLCCPYLAAVYFIYVISIIVRNIISKKSPELAKSVSPIFSTKGMLFVTAGVIISVIVFFVIVFSRGSFGDVYNSILRILENPVHPPKSFAFSIKSYIFAVFMQERLSLLVYICLGVLFLVVSTDRKRKCRKVIYFSTASVLTLALMFLRIRMNYINYLMWAINALGVFVVLLSDRKSNVALFSTFWALGMMYSFCSHWASNQGFYAISSAASVATIGTILMVCSFVDECLKENPKRQYKYPVLIIVVAIISTQLLSQTFWRYKSVFWEDGGMPAQTEYISEGVQSGIYVSKEKLAEYNKMYARISQLKKYDGDCALFIARDTRYYLYGEYDVGAYSAWLEKVNPIVLEQLEIYYDLNPQKLPDIGYIEMGDPNLDYVAIAERFKLLYGYEWFYDADGIVLIKSNK